MKIHLLYFHRLENEADELVQPGAIAAAEPSRREGNNVTAPA
jgi:hypothetical protein